MASVVVDDHLLRDILTGECAQDLDGIAAEGVATTGLWLFQLCSSLADPAVAAGSLLQWPACRSDIQARLREQLAALPVEIEILPLRELSWSMAELRHRHRTEGRGLSAAMVEALAAAHRLDAGIAVSKRDVGPNLRSAARADGIEFNAL